MVLACGAGSRREVGPRSRSCGLSSPVTVRRSRLFPGLDEGKQHDRERENERAVNQRRGSCVEGIGEGIFKNVESPTKEGHAEEASKAPESVHQPAAHDERLGRTHTRSVMALFLPSQERPDVRKSNRRSGPYERRPA